MKKQHKRILFAVIVALLILCLSALYIISITDYMGVTVDMDIYQIRALIPGERLYNNFPYYFFRNNWGNPVVVKADFNVLEIRCYSSLWTSLDPRAFACIKQDMSIFEVIELVGIPFGPYNGYLKSAFYRDTEGNEYVIDWVERSGDYRADRLTKNGTVLFGDPT